MALGPAEVPFTPNAIFRATDPQAVIGYGYNTDTLNTYPLLTNECGVLTRQSACGLVLSGGGTGAFSRSETISVPIDAVNDTQLLAANSDRVFALIRNHGPNTMYVGPNPVLPGDTANSAGGALLQPGEVYELVRTDTGITEAIHGIVPSGALPNIVYVGEG